MSLKQALIMAANAANDATLCKDAEKILQSLINDPELNVRINWIDEAEGIIALVDIDGRDYKLILTRNNKESTR